MFGIMLENLQENEQLIFTTHNTDMLDLNLPKHTYAFLRKEKTNNHYDVSVMYASDVLKRNTDSIRCAAENDVFSSIPDESLLDSLSGLQRRDVLISLKTSVSRNSSMLSKQLLV